MALGKHRSGGLVAGCQRRLGIELLGRREGDANASIVPQPYFNAGDRNPSYLDTHAAIPDGHASAYVDLNSHSCANGYTDANAYANIYPNQYTHTHAHSYSNVHPFPYRYPDVCSYGYSDGYADIRAHSGTALSSRLI